MGIDDKEVSLLRADTPGCKTKIHFNNAGAALMPAPVLRAMKEYIDFESVTGGYEAADSRARAIEGFYSSMAKLLNAKSENLAFTSSATNSFARAVSAIPFNKGDAILIAQEDYISNQLTFMSLRDRMGLQLIRAESLPEGGVDPDHMALLMDKHRPRLVSLSHIPTNSGLIQPAALIGKLCRERNIPYLLDACQSAGQLSLDVDELNCDFLTGTFRKFMRGPRGAGFLFVADRMLAQPLGPLYFDMRSADWTGIDTYSFRPDARRFEDWELPYALVLGSAAATDYALSVGLERIAKRNAMLDAQVRSGLQRLGLTILDQGPMQSSIITVKMDGWEPTPLLQLLRSRNINTSITSRSSAIPDFDRKGVQWALRISPHYYNTSEEVNELIRVLGELKRVDV